MQSWQAGEFDQALVCLIPVALSTSLCSVPKPVQSPHILPSAFVWDMIGEGG